jgi:hypothetical protein
MAGREYRLSILVSGQDTGAKSMLSGVGSALGSIGQIAGGILTAGFLTQIGNVISDIAKESVLSAGRVRELAIVNQVLAKNAGLSSSAVVNAADAVRRMGIEAAVSENVVAKFISNQLDVTKASQLARIAQDAAVISGQNSTQALDGLTQGLITLQPEVLRTYGLFVDSQLAYKNYAKQIGKSAKNLTTQQKQQALLNATLEQGEAIAGAYEAAMKSASKQIRSWPRYLNDIAVAVGTPFQNSFDKSAGAISKVLKNLGETVSVGGVFYPFIKGLADGADLAATRFENFLQTIGLLKSDFEDERGWTDPNKNPLDGIKKWFTDIDIVALSDAFKTGARNIDWATLSTDISTGIDNIDWAGIGAKIHTSAANIWKGISFAASEINWVEIGTSLGGGFGNLMAGLTGQGDTQNVINTWVSNITAMLDTITLVKIKLRSEITTWQAETTTGIANWAISMRTGLATWQAETIAAISGAILSWLVPIRNGMNIIKNEMIAKAQSWITQPVGVLQSMGQQLVDAVSSFILKIKSVIKPLSIKIGIELPNFEAAAAVVEAGLAFLQGATGGGGKPSLAQGSFVSGSGGVNLASRPSASKPTTTNQHGFEGGGIARGPITGYPATLHGTEAVVPLESGSIPVSLGQLNPSGGGGATMININFAYSPMVSTASRFEAADVIAPMIAEQLRQEFGKRNF